MALQFQPPPDWLIQEYFNRKHPVAQAAEGVQNVLGTYMNLEQQQKKNELIQSQMDSQKATQQREGREMFTNYGDPTGLPTDVQGALQSQPQGPVEASGVGPRESPLIAWSRQFQAKYPQGIKGQEKQQNNRPQQVPNLINGKPAVFNPATSQYEIAQVVDPTIPQTQSNVVPEPVFTPRYEPPVPTQFVGVQDGKPVLFNPKTKTMETGALPGAGPLTSTTQTEGQANAKLYAQRMEEADVQLNNLSSQVDLSSVRSGVEGKLPNIAKSQNIQLFEQSKRNFLNAVLRRESGAVISPTEFAEGNRQYFEVMGDSPLVKQQKAMNRKTAIAGLKNAAGEVTGGNGSSGGWSYVGKAQ